MKNIFCIISIFVSLMLSSCSGDMFDNIKEHATEEKVFVGKFDKAEGRVGLNRVEIDLMNAGRIPSEQVKIGKAVKTVVEYDNVKHTYEPVPSWINLTGLTESKLYRIQVFNEDGLGNRSLPVEVAVIPFTDEDLASLVAPAPEKSLSPTSAILRWPNGLSSSFYDYYEMEYSYIDQTGAKTMKTNGSNITLTSLVEGSEGTVQLKLKTVPRHNSEPILDTAYLESTVSYKLPTIPEYLATRTARKVTNPFLDGSTAKVEWGSATEDLVFTELEYETTAGTLATVTMTASQNSVECPDAKPGVQYKTRSAFTPPGSTDVLYKDWVTSRYPFIAFPTGTFKVDPMSWIAMPDNTPRFPLPQPNFSAPRTVTITGEGEAQYRISDLFGGYYEVGSNYGDGYRCWGVFIYDGTSPWELIDSRPDPWGTGWYGLSGTYNAATQTIELTVPWGPVATPNYIFHLTLIKQ
jgi:hypothetical protein